MKRTPIRKASKKRAKALKAYNARKRKFLWDHRYCEARIAPFCEFYGTQLHHIKGRGKFLNDTHWFMPVCIPCHAYIHNHPVEARKKGLLLT